MNLAIFKMDESLKRLLINATQQGNHFEGDNGSITLKPEKFQLVWTNDSTITQIYADKEDPSGKISQILIGYKETIEDFTPAIPPSHLRREVKLSRQGKIDLSEKLEDLAGLSFAQLDQYIDNNVIDLASAKQFLKKQAKVILALIKTTQG